MRAGLWLGAAGSFGREQANRINMDAGQLKRLMRQCGMVDLRPTEAAVKLASAIEAKERERWHTLVAGAHLYRGDCPDAGAWDSRDPECPACRSLGDWQCGIVNQR